MSKHSDQDNVKGGTPKQQQRIETLRRTIARNEKQQAANQKRGGK